MKIRTELSAILTFLSVSILANPALPDSLQPAMTPWVIHVVSLRAEQEAQGLKDALSKSGYPNAYLAEFIKDGTKWHRVRVGFYPTKEEAQKEGIAISKKFFTPEPWITKADKEEALKLTEKTSWVIHVASLRAGEEARGLKDTLSKSGYPNVYLAEFIKDGTRWHRVRVGFYPTKEQAQKEGIAISEKFSTPSPWITKAAEEDITIAAASASGRGEGALIKQSRAEAVFGYAPPSKPVSAMPERKQIPPRKTAVINKIALPPPANMMTVAGGEINGYSGDNGPATLAKLSYPESIFVDSKNNIFIADTNNHSIRKIDPSGTITTIAGTGKPGYSGDNGPATSAQLNYPYGVFADQEGNIYIADTYNFRIRKVSPNGVIRTVAGNGTGGFAGDGAGATTAKINYPYNITVDSKGAIYIADTYNHSIRRVDPNGIITTVAGTGKPGYSGDGEKAIMAKLNYPSSVSVDSKGNIYISDTDNYSIRKVDSSGVITTAASNGAAAYSVYDRTKAYSQAFNYSYNISVDPAGNIYLADTYNHRIRKVLATIDVASKD